MQFCFQEYEDQSSAEAKFVKDLDRFDMIFQVNIFSWLNFAFVCPFFSFQNIKVYSQRPGPKDQRKFWPSHSLSLGVNAP